MKRDRLLVSMSSRKYLSSNTASKRNLAKRAQLSSKSITSLMLSSTKQLKLITVKVRNVNHAHTRVASAVIKCGSKRVHE